MQAGHGTPKDSARDTRPLDNNNQQGELDWLLALLTRLKEGKHLAVARADRGPAQRVADMAQDKATRWGGGLRCFRRAALHAWARLLHEGVVFCVQQLSVRWVHFASASSALPPHIRARAQGLPPLQRAARGVGGAGRRRVRAGGGGGAGGRLLRPAGAATAVLAGEPPRAGRASAVSSRAAFLAALRHKRGRNALSQHHHTPRRSFRCR